MSLPKSTLSLSNGKPRPPSVSRENRPQSLLRYGQEGYPSPYDYFLHVPSTDPKEGVEFRSLSENIDTNTSFGKFYFHMAAALAELERDRLIERTTAGLKAAKARGRRGGRKRALSVEQEALVLDMLRDGTRSQADVAKLMRVSAPTISRLVDRAGKLAEAAD
jgi:hypothetical protein